MKKDTTTTTQPVLVVVADHNTKNLLEALGLKKERVEAITLAVQNKMNEFRDTNGSYSTLQMIVESSKLCSNVNELAFMCYKVGGYLESRKPSGGGLLEALAAVMKPRTRNDNPAPEIKTDLDDKANSVTSKTTTDENAN